MDSSFDRQFSEQGVHLLCGIDEAGRGALAGPVVAAAVILPPGIEIKGLDDSKKLTPNQRIDAAEDIRDLAVGFGIGQASVEEIDRLNILQATFLAMQRAVHNLPVEPDYCLIDGRDFPLIFYKNQKAALRGKAVIKGDGLSQCIAAASVIAKTYRDYLMNKLDPDFPVYGFADHKGYGTKRHRDSILQFGPSKIHRRSFLRKINATTGVKDEWLN
ncbi:MAG: ribonuclease HII [Calditrichaceae bacterium]|nr:ribonuclease HII [Calditrichaceae bacterium]